MRSCSTERRETPSWIGILPLLLCLSPFLVGEDLQRWRIETDDKWLIYTPKNRIDIDEYPAIPDHLRPFKDLLEKRATKQKWFELEQAQASCEAWFRQESRSILR